MFKSLTHVDFIKRLVKLHSDIYTMSMYKKTNESIIVMHSCGRIWNTTPQNLLKPRGCSKCNKKYKPSHAEFVMRVHEARPDIRILGKYENNKKKILVEHNCGYKWNIAPPTLYKKDIGCPKCSKTVTPTTIEFIEELKKVSPDIEVIGEYISAATPIKVKHTCGYVWAATPNNLKRGSGCCMCKRSKSEKEIFKYLRKNTDYNILASVRDLLKPNSSKWLELDIYIPDLNIAIEYHGIQHYEYVEYFHRNDPHKLLEQQARDKETRDECLSMNIKLIEISYMEYSSDMPIDRKYKFLENLKKTIDTAAKLT